LPTEETKRRLAGMMGWSTHTMDVYYQAALNLMPLSRAIPAQAPERFYEAVLAGAVQHAGMAPVAGNEHKAAITLNSIAESTLAAYDHNEVRWTSAYLLHDSVRPRNLKVVSDAVVDKVVFSRLPSQELAATGVVVRIDSASDSDAEVTADSGTQRQKLEYLVQLDAHGEVALTGGALGCVSVLQRSGVG
jgi:hypothetical protein